MKHLLSLVFFLSVLTSVQVASNNLQQEPIKILFIGSSYFNFFDLPALFEGLADEAGYSILIERNIKNGTYLADYADDNYTISKIQEEKWDYVVLQGVEVLTAYPDQVSHHPVYPALQKLKFLIEENCQTTTMIFCLHWAYEDGMTWVEGWTDTCVDMQDKITTNTMKYSNDIGFTIAPVGNTWAEVLKRKGYPLHYLHLSDWNHTSLKGTFLMACVIYFTIFLESCERLEFNSSISDDEADSFKKTASDIVLNNLSLWNITTVDNETEHSMPSDIILNQNYPNPFNPTTHISFFIKNHYSHVLLQVYDMLGKSVNTIIDDYYQSGGYEVTFSGKNLSSGTYFYRL